MRVRSGSGLNWISGMETDQMAQEREQKMKKFHVLNLFGGLELKQENPIFRGGLKI
jgi:hypothetical protein